MGIHPSTWEVVMLKQSLMLAAVTTILAACGAENPTAPEMTRVAPSNARSAVVVAHPEPGVPGTPGCRGQTVAYIAQVARSEDVAGANGLGGVARFDGMSVKDLQALADAYCAGV
jgi:hypothetical protein